MKTVFVIIVASLLGLTLAGGGGGGKGGGKGGGGKGRKGGGKKNDFDGYRAGRGSLIPFVYPQPVPVSVPFRIEVPKPYPVPEPYPVYKTVYVPFKVVEKEIVEVVKNVPVEVVKYIPIAIDKGAMSHTSYSEPSYSAPAHSPPSYSAPSYSAPSYSAPSYSAPSYSAPSHSATSYSVNSYTAPPSYGAPHHGAPSHSSHIDGPSSSYSSGAGSVHTSHGQHTSSHHGAFGVSSLERGTFQPSSPYHDVNGTPVHHSNSLHGVDLHGLERIRVGDSFQGSTISGHGGHLFMSHDETNSPNDHSFRFGRSVQLGGQFLPYPPAGGSFRGQTFHRQSH